MYIMTGTLYRTQLICSSDGEITTTCIIAIKRHIYFDCAHHTGFHKRDEANQTRVQPSAKLHVMNEDRTPWDQLKWHSTTIARDEQQACCHAPRSMHQHLVFLLAICLVAQAPLAAARPRVSNSVIDDDAKQILKLHALKNNLDTSIAKSMMGFDDTAVYELAKKNSSPFRRQPTARFVDDSPIIMQVSADVVETPPAPTIVSKTERRSTQHFTYDIKDYQKDESVMRPACAPSEIACPSTRKSRFVRCISMRQLCDGVAHCPRGEDEREQECMFYKATATFMALKFEHILRSFHLYHDSLDALWQRQRETDRFLHAEL